jgi:hypothetical protein
VPPHLISYSREYLKELFFLFQKPLKASELIAELKIYRQFS